MKIIKDKTGCKLYIVENIKQICAMEQLQSQLVRTIYGLNEEDCMPSCIYIDGNIAGAYNSKEEAEKELNDIILFITNEEDTVYNMR